MDDWSMDESEDRKNIHDFVQDVYSGCYSDMLSQDTLKHYEDLRGKFILARDSRNARLAKLTADQLNKNQFASLTECTAYSIITEDPIDIPGSLFKFKSFKEYLVCCEDLWEAVLEGSEPGNTFDELIQNVTRCAMYNSWNLHTIHNIVYSDRASELLW